MYNNVGSGNELDITYPLTSPLPIEESLRKTPMFGKQGGCSEGRKSQRENLGEEIEMLVDEVGRSDRKSVV